MSTNPTTPTPEAIEAAARAWAIHDEIDGCFERVDAWEELAEWEKEAHPDEYPGSDYEDCTNYRERATAALTAAYPFIAAQAGATPRAAILAEVSAGRERQDAKWGEQNHPNGTGDGVPLLHGVDLPKPHAHVGVTMGTLAYTARSVTDSYAATGQVTWADILLEEVGEAFAEHDPDTLRAELIQVAAVAAQWVEAIDRNARAATMEGKSE